MNYRLAELAALRREPLDPESRFRDARRDAHNAAEALTQSIALWLEAPDGDTYVVTS